MGSISEIIFADYPIFYNKNWYYEEIVNLIFHPNDFIIEKRKLSAKNKLVWGDAYEDEKDDFEFKGFRQTVKVCRQRLEIYGTTLKSSKKDFNNAKRISTTEQFYGFSLRNITYEKYLNEIDNIIQNKEVSYDFEEYHTNFRKSLKELDLGIYGQESNYHLYSILSVLPDNAIIEYDLTNVIEGGWVSIDIAQNIKYEKIIILTEGKTDVEFISKSIEKLYPHLKNYYHFIDFQEYKIESNASALVKLVTSFAAANVKHPIIALFDNDTTGIMEMNKLNKKALTENIRVLRFPDISLAKKYPTIGPTGKKVMNVNGLACGIEMYLGSDILTKENGLIPVRWKNFNEKEKKYQGEIVEKSYVQDEFRKKLKNTSNEGYLEMNCLLNEIFNGLK